MCVIERLFYDKKIMRKKTIQKHPPEVFYEKKGVLRNFAKFTGKRLCQSIFLNKVAGLRPAILLKKDSGTGVFLRI